MDFVERIIGISPDGGSGALEFAIFFGLVLLSALALRVSRAAHKR